MNLTHALDSIESELRELRGRPVRIAKAVVGGGGGGDDPDGSGSCDCDNCAAGTTISDALECCTSHLRWSLTNPWTECEDTDLTLEYIGGDEWMTEPFDGTDGNEWRWKLTIDVDGVSYLTLVLETNNEGAEICVVYGREGFDCQCDNEFTLKKPLGTWIGLPRSELSCIACIKPISQERCDALECEWPEIIGVILPDVFTEAEAGSLCSEIAGEHHLAPYPFDEPQDCVWGKVITSGGCEVLIRLGIASTGIRVVHLTVQLSCGSDPAGATSYHNWAVSLEDFPGCVDPIVLAWSPSLSATDFHCVRDEDIEESEAQVLLVTPSPSETGVCNETCETPPEAPEDPDGGACCLQSVCYDFWEETLCDDMGGEWLADGCGECETVGSCCYDGSCYGLNETDCEALTGNAAFWSADPCSARDCGDFDPTVGCCCGVGGVGVDGVSDTDCAPELFHGGTDCADVTCPTNVGACCQTPAGELDCSGGGICECTIRASSHCSGNYAGDGTECTTPGPGEDCDCRGSECDF